MAQFENPGFLHRKDPNLFRSPGVEGAVKRKEILEEKKTSTDALARIQTYLNLLKRFIDRKDPERKERGIEVIKRLLYINFVIKPEDIPESFWNLQKKIARENGHGEIEITDTLKHQHAEVLIADQKSTLDLWIDYLTGPDASYPDYLKFWTIRSILNMGEYDKEKKSFATRSKGTTTTFPDLNQEALAYVLDVINKKYDPVYAEEARPYGPITEEQYIQDNALGPITEEQHLIENESFSKLYAFAIEKVTPASKELLRITKGEWKEYKKDSDHLPLVKSLQGHGTGWCTAGESTAQAQLSKGDFHVFYSHDENGNPTIPRVAIRMEGDSIAEVRGIAHQQNLDSFISPRVSEKLSEFKDGPLYQKKVEDMSRLTRIERKANAGQALTKDDIVFLYEVNEKIQGFGYRADPRIEEIREKRDLKEDMSIFFDCASNQVAYNEKEITKNTKAYIGPLFKGIFKQLSNVEHIYESFPHDKIRQQSLEVGGQTAAQLEDVMNQANIRIDSSALDALRSKENPVSTTKEQRVLVRFQISKLFNDNKSHTTEQIYKKAKLLGLEFCPFEVGPRLRHQYTDQAMNEYLYVAMKPFVGADGGRHVLDLYHYYDGMWLSSERAEPEIEWPFHAEFVFLLPKER